jgi:oligopeptide/dipeptide ABC transporter ATP-binding protein
VTAAAPPLLEVRDVVVEIRGRHGAARVVDGVSLRMERGEIVGLVGESGCGKSMVAYSILNLFPTPAARVASGHVLLEGRDLAALTPEEQRTVRGARIGMVFQDPASALDPLMPAGRQVSATLRLHGRAEEAATRVPELMRLMELPDPDDIARRYPHELSGGQRQRVLIAAALAMRPALLIADEPTTALDVTVQASILNLLGRLRETLGLAILLITHDLGIIAEGCDRVYVMYAGRIVETNDVAGLFATPRHPYTKGLLRGALSVEAFDGELFSIPGSVPDLRNPPDGCRFRPRCPLAAEICQNDPPLMPREAAAADGRVRADGADACWRALEPAAAHVWDSLAGT